MRSQPVRACGFAQAKRQGNFEGGDCDDDHDDDFRNGGSSGEESPGVGALGDGAIFGQTRGAAEAISNRDSVGGRRVGNSPNTPRAGCGVFVGQSCPRHIMIGEVTHDCRDDHV